MQEYWNSGACLSSPNSPTRIDKPPVSTSKRRLAGFVSLPLRGSPTIPQTCGQSGGCAGATSRRV
jgi:hypothetical protein